jgi:hypothetical protein
MVCHGSRRRAYSCQPITGQGRTALQSLPVIPLANNSQEYLASRAKLFNPVRASPEVIHVGTRPLFHPAGYELSRRVG